MRAMKKLLFATAASFLLAAAASAQVKPDDTPTFNIGSTIFADYTYVASPETKDADGNAIHSSSFNISRAYVNVTGNLNHRIAFRVTPDVTRDGNGSQTFRLKYAFAQFNLDDWTTHGSWVRFGVQQTPIIDYEEGIYRYRFQGQVFIERVGLLPSSDAGLSGHYNFPGNYGDLHGGIYNGEGYNHAETNNQKALQLRATLRPLPLGGVWKGLRVTGFIDEDHYVEGAKRQRLLGQVTFEHPRINAGIDVVHATDQTSARAASLDGKGWSIWTTPKLNTNGWELLLRHDDYKSQKRDIFGVAYWFQNLTRVTSAVLVDYDSLKQNDTRYGVKLLVNF
jgi:opacity protein-like surface antigen